MKTALVTGASAGIGKATVLRLRRDGYAVYAAARRTEKMKDLEEAGAVALKMDITVEEDVRAVVDRIRADRGGIDVLVNNAGFGLYGAMEDTSLEDARYQFEVNLFGLARVTQLALPSMREKRSGTIINISSIGGRIYTPLGSWYHGTKHALEGWSDCLRLEVAEFGIHVVVVQPGAIKTEFGDVMTGPMMERSGRTAYARLARALADGVKREYDSGRASPPSVIADVISRALKAKRPKTRYTAGRYHQIVALKRWLPDRWFDALILSQAK